jgi:hypothetical protein
VFGESLIVRSGQGWKALTFVCGSMLSALSFFSGLALFSGKQTTFALCLVFLGAGIFICSLLFACVSIRCPHCGARWVWLAVTRADAGHWISTLMAQRVCRACGR